jgi:hypothetical protein
LTRSDSVSATLHGDDLLRIRTTRLVRGVDVGGSLWLGVEAVPWLIEALEVCLETLASSEAKIGADALRVKEKGHELDPQVGIGNRRAAPAERAGRYFVAMREAVARDLVEQLRRL